MTGRFKRKKSQVTTCHGGTQPGQHCQKCDKVTRKELQRFYWEKGKGGGFESKSGRGATGVHVYDCRKREEFKKREKDRQRKQGPSEGKEADEIRKRRNGDPVKSKIE